MEKEQFMILRKNGNKKNELVTLDKQPTFPSQTPFPQETANERVNLI